MMRRKIAGWLALFMLIAVMPAGAAVRTNVETAADGGSAIQFGSGTAADGVDFKALEKGNVYYGTARHPLQLNGQDFFYTGPVTKEEETATPILWECKGEEQDADGNGDGRVTLLSKHILNSLKFSDAAGGISNDYTQSAAAAWLNDAESGFVQSAFSAAENQAVPLTEVVTANYSCDGKNTELTADAGQTWPKTVQQKLYLPWGTYSGLANGTVEYPGTDGEPRTVYWSAKPIQGRNQIADTMRGQAGTLKSTGTRIQYMLRSPASGGTGSVLGVSANNPNACVFKAGTGTQIGVRPVMKLEPGAVVFASEIRRSPENAAQTAAVAPILLEGEPWNPNYKLTVLGSDGSENPYSISLQGITPGSVLEVEKGESLAFQTVDPSHSGAEYSINYKAVMAANGKRHIVAYGQSGPVNPAGTGTSLSVPTDSWPRSGGPADHLDLYIWLQKNTAEHVNEASAPIHIPVSLTGGTAAPLPTAEPEPLDPETAARTVICYPEGKMKAALLNFDDTADFIVNADKHLLDIFSKNGLKGTFNVISGQCDVNDAKLFSSRLSQYDGQELASHTVTHPHLDQITDGEFKAEIENSKTFVEGLAGHERVTGLAYPYYYRADTARLEMIREAGYLYTRRTDDSKHFYIPESFYNWNPTMWVLRADTTGGPPAILNKAQEFLDLDPRDTMRVMFVWGHATDFGNWESEGNQWDYIERYCKALGDNLQIIWNPTCQEFVDYVNAAKLLEMSKGNGGAIRLDNTRSNTAVWTLVDGGPVEIPAGQVKEVDPDTVRPGPTYIPVPVETPVPTGTPAPTETAGPTETPNPTEKPAVSAKPTPLSAARVYQFQTDEIGSTPQADGLTVTTAGDSTVLAEKSPHDPPFVYFTSGEAYLANAEGTQNKVLKAAKGEGNGGTAAVTVDLGQVEGDLAVEWKMIRKGSNAVVELVNGDVVQPILGVDVWNTVGLMAKNRNAAKAIDPSLDGGMTFADVWTPVGMVFHGLGTDQPTMDFYWQGRYNYTPFAGTPIAGGMPTFEKAHFELGGLLDKLELGKMDWSRNTQLRFSISYGTDAGAYFDLDDIRTYAPSGTVRNSCSLDFEQETPGLMPQADCIETGSYWSRGGRDVELADGTKIRPTNISYDMQVAADPADPSNQVLKFERGNGSNEANYGALARGIINKPSSQVELAFRVMASGMGQNAGKLFNVFVKDGNYHGYFPDNDAIQQGISLFHIDNQGNVKGPENMWTGKTLEENTWIQVRIVYDIAAGRYTLYLNGENAGTKESTALAEAMATQETALTFGFKHANAAMGQKLYLDDLVLGQPDTPSDTSVTLYQDSACTVPLAELTGTVYAKRGGTQGKLILAAYGAGDRLLAVSVSEGESAALDLPAGTSRAAAFVWRDLETIEPRTASAVFSERDPQ